MVVKTTLEDFIKKSKEKHGDKYDYSLSEYICRKTPIKIICPIHGVFLQAPECHYVSGCQLCGTKSKTESRKRSQEGFIKLAKKKHGDKYDYSLVKYINCKENVEIICKIHGSFIQTPDRHLLAKIGCPKCSGNVQLTQKEFIQKARSVHGDRYDYSKSIYKTYHEKIDIICPIHGVFSQTAGSHLNERGCKKCSSSVSKIELAWLDSMKIPNDKEHRQVRNLIPGRKFVVDGYDPETKTVYEFYGDKAHGNPDVYHPEGISDIDGIPFKVAYDRTLEREKIFKEAGYNIVSIWEFDYRCLISSKISSDCILDF